MDCETLLKFAQIDPSLVGTIIMREEDERQRESHLAFIKALSALQSELPEIIKNERIVKMGQSGVIGYDYATIDKIKETIKPYLAKHGFAYTFKFADIGDGIMCTCKLMHVGGHIEECEMESGKDTSLSDTNDIQKIGSTMSYLMRYTLTAVLGLATTQDTDANNNNVTPKKEVIPSPMTKETTATKDIPSPKTKKQKKIEDNNNIFMGGENDTTKNTV